MLPVPQPVASLAAAGGPGPFELTAAPGGPDRGPLAGTARLAVTAQGDWPLSRNRRPEEPLRPVAVRATQHGARATAAEPDPPAATGIGLLYTTQCALQIAAVHAK